METQVSVTTASASVTTDSTSLDTTMRPPSVAAQSSTACGGRSSSGQARRSSNLKRTAACIHEVAMLLPSPDHATTLPSIGPRCSSKVITSAMSWQGCVTSVSRSEEHTSELQSLMRISYAVFCLKKTKTKIEST